MLDQSKNTPPPPCFARTSFPIIHPPWTQLFPPAPPLSLAFVCTSRSSVLLSAPDILLHPLLCHAVLCFHPSTPTYCPPQWPCKATLPLSLKILHGERACTHLQAGRTQIWAWRWEGRGLPKTKKAAKNTPSPLKVEAIDRAHTWEHRRLTVLTAEWTTWKTSDETAVRPPSRGNYAVSAGSPNGKQTPGRPGRNINSKHSNIKSLRLFMMNKC